jgi:hypothetical protein
VSPLPPIGPLAPPLAAPLPVPDDAYAVPAAVSLDRCAEVANAEILGSLLRPGDMASETRIAPPRLAFVPFWRVEATVDGFHVGLTHTTREDGRMGFPIPTGGARHRDAALLITARRLYAYEPRLLQFSPAFTAAAGAVTGMHHLGIPAAEMAPLGSVQMTGEIVDADVPRDAAERQAMDMMLRAVQPRSAIYAKYEPKIRSIAFTYYPLAVVRYRYEGHARRHPGEAFWVVVSARSGKVVGGHHPSALRSLTARVRKFLTV